MDNNARKVLIELLDMASEHFGNHICNDYELPNTPENRELMKKAARWNSIEEWEEYGLHISNDGTKIYTQDFFLMAYFSYLLRQI